jgi:biopolymer transport protein ExbB
MATQSSDWFTSGGLVMLPLLGFSILAVTLIVERVRFWAKVVKRTDRFVREFLTQYRRNQPNAFKLLERNKDLPMARIFSAALELDNPNPEEFRLALESAAQAEIPILKRFNTIFDTIVNLSPLLGLLGTVLGLIRSFSSMNVKNAADLAGGSGGVTGGISEALISTASGLVVAIFTLFFANAFRGFYQRQLALIQEYGGQLELLQRRRPYRGAPYIPTSEPRN